MLETWHLVCKYTQIFSFRKYRTKTHLILLMSVFFFLYSKQNCESCVRDFSVLFSVFVRYKVTSNENISFTDYASGIRLPNCSKLTINRKNDNDVIICWHDVIVHFFWRCLVSIVTFRYWSKFHVNITGSRVMIIFIYEGLTRNPEIGNSPVWVWK